MDTTNVTVEGPHHLLIGPSILSLEAGPEFGVVEHKIPFPSYEGIVIPIEVCLDPVDIRDVKGHIVVLAHETFQCAPVRWFVYGLIITESNVFA